MSKSGRQEMAYRKYLRKHMGERYKQIARARGKADRKLKVKMKSLPESAPKISAKAEPVPAPGSFSGSEAPPSDGSQQQP
jgi:hypothetical protein